MQPTNLQPIYGSCQCINDVPDDIVYISLGAYKVPAPLPIGLSRVQVQFHARGPSGKARVTADMYQDGSKQWQYSFLFVDVDAPVPQRVAIVGPQYSS